MSMSPLSPPARPFWIWVPSHRGVPRFACLTFSVPTCAGVRICEPARAPADALRTYLRRGPWCWLARSKFHLHNKPRRRAFSCLQVRELRHGGGSWTYQRPHGQPRAERCLDPGPCGARAPDCHPLPCPSLHMPTGVCLILSPPPVSPSLCTVTVQCIPGLKAVSRNNTHSWQHLGT